MVISVPIARVHALMSATPLSWDLRDFPGAFNEKTAGLPLRWRLHLQSKPALSRRFITRSRSLLPESFRGGCSFGFASIPESGERSPAGDRVLASPAAPPADRDVAKHHKWGARSQANAKLPHLHTNLAHRNFQIRLTSVRGLRSPTGPVPAVRAAKTRAQSPAARPCRPGSDSDRT